MKMKRASSLPDLPVLFLVVVLLAPLLSAQAGNTYLDLEALIFTDGSTFLQGEASSNPALPVNYANGTFSGVTSKLTSKAEERWQFTARTQETFDELNARFVLPKGARLVTGSIKSNSLPVVQIQGESLVVVVSDTRKALFITFSYEIPIDEQPRQEFPILIIYLAAIVIAAAIVFFILRSRKKKAGPQKKSWRKKSSSKKEAKETKEQKVKGTGSLDEFKRKFSAVKQTLNEREIKILESLLELGGQAKQNQLQKFTGIPKAAFSRHIASLDAKSLISKKSLGRVNLIQVKVE